VYAYFGTIETSMLKGKTKDPPHPKPPKTPNPPPHKTPNHQEKRTQELLEKATPARVLEKEFRKSLLRKRPARPMADSATFEGLFDEEQDLEQKKKMDLLNLELNWREGVKDSED